MIADCDLRMQRLIEAKVRQSLQEIDGSLYELTILKITHEPDRVIVQGISITRPGEQEKRFAMLMPRMDGPLDHFL